MGHLSWISPNSNSLHYCWGDERRVERGKETKKEKKIGIGQHGVTAKKEIFLGRCYILVLPLVYDLVLVNIDQPQTQKLYNFII